jgi:hypothetical protein
MELLRMKLFRLFNRTLCLSLFGLALLGAALTSHAQNKPAAEYQSLLNMRFYEANAGFLVENVQLVFPPQGIAQAELLISKVNGPGEWRVPLRYEAYQQFPAFGNLVPAGGPGGILIDQAGDFMMTVKLGGAVITQMPFSFKLEEGNDPFNPQKRYVREGPWRDWAFISVPMDDLTPNINFNFWISAREFPAGVKSPKVNVHLMLGNQEIGVTRSPIVPSYIDWTFYTKELVTPAGLAPGSPHYLTLADLKKDGDFTIVLKANGQPLKSYKFQVKGGEIQRPENSRLNYEPHAAFISPRYIDISAGSSSRYHMRDMFWVKKNAR